MCMKELEKAKLTKRFKIFAVQVEKILTIKKKMYLERNDRNKSICTIIQIYVGGN